MNALITYPVTLHYANGKSIDAEVSMPNKPYWADQLEREIKETYNRNSPPHGIKVVRVAYSKLRSNDTEN